MVLIGDLLAEIVPLAEFLPNNVHDILGMGIVFGKDECLGYFLSAGEYLGKQLFLKGSDNCPYLVGGNHIAVQLVGSVFQVFVQLLPAHFSV